MNEPASREVVFTSLGSRSGASLILTGGDQSVNWSRAARDVAGTPLPVSPPVHSPPHPAPITPHATAPAIHFVSFRILSLVMEIIGSRAFSMSERGNWIEKLAMESRLSTLAERA